MGAATISEELIAHLSFQGWSRKAVKKQASAAILDRKILQGQSRVGGYIIELHGSFFRCIRTFGGKAFEISNVGQSFRSRSLQVG